MSANKAAIQFLMKRVREDWQAGEGLAIADFFTGQMEVHHFPSGPAPSVRHLPPMAVNAAAGVGVRRAYGTPARLSTRDGVPVINVPIEMFDLESVAAKTILPGVDLIPSQREMQLLSKPSNVREGDAELSKALLENVTSLAITADACLLWLGIRSCAVRCIAFDGSYPRPFVIRDHVQENSREPATPSAVPLRGSDMLLVSPRGTYVVFGMPNEFSRSETLVPMNRTESFERLRV